MLNAGLISWKCFILHHGVIITKSQSRSEQILHVWKNKNIFCKENITTAVDVTKWLNPIRTGESSPSSDFTHHFAKINLQTTHIVTSKFLYNTGQVFLDIQYSLQSIVWPTFVVYHMSIQITIWNRLFDLFKAFDYISSNSRVYRKLHFKWWHLQL